MWHFVPRNFHQKLLWSHTICSHCNDVIMSSMAFQITSLTIVCSIVYSRADQRKHKSSASLAFVWEIHRWPVNSPHKGPVTRIFFSFDDVIISNSSVYIFSTLYCPPETQFRFCLFGEHLFISTDSEHRRVVIRTRQDTTKIKNESKVCSCIHSPFLSQNQNYRKNIALNMHTHAVVCCYLWLCHPFVYGSYGLFTHTIYIGFTGNGANAWIPISMR